MKLNDRLKCWFFAEDDGTLGGGTAVFDAPAHDGDAQQLPKDKEKEEVPAQEEPKPAEGTINAKEFAKEFGSVIASEMGKARETAKETKPLTAEEAKKLLNVWDPTPEWITKFDNLETRNAAIAEMRDGMVKNADTISQHRMKELEGTIEKRFGPALEYMQRQDAIATETRFDKTFPQLAKPGLKPVIKAVAEGLVAKGKKFDDEASMFEAIGKEVEAVIKETNPDFKLEKAGSTPEKKPNKNPNAIPVTTPGSGGGTGKESGGQQVAKPRGLAIFEK